jgi:serine/threonine protein kinase/tetratricopeptide (TPR) repeat protein
MTPQLWARVKALFSEALERRPEEREELLNASTEDAEVVREARRLLLAHDEAGSFLEGSAPGREAGHPAPRVFADGDRVGDRGRFRIVRLIGAGGMGQVYEAVDLELNTRIALKAVHPQLTAEQHAAERFRREVQAARCVTHPNVCRIFDIATHADGVSFLTMELLEGHTLAERLGREGPLPPETAIPLVIQLAEGLAAAHRAGVVHRDFKSGNVILVGDRAVITDFGLARRADPGEEAGASYSSTRFLGTPAYMAPEQLEGGPITPAADIYALGVVMYEMAAGRLPFTGSPLEIAVRKLKNDPETPRRYAATLPAEWESIIMKCLQRDPARRPLDAEGLAAALRQPRVSSGGQPWRRLPPVRQRLARWMAAGTLLVLVVALLVTWPVMKRETPDVAETLRRGAAASSHLGQRYTDNLEAYHLYLRGRHHWKRLTPDEVAKGIALFQQALAADPQFAPAYSGLADAYSTMNDYGGMAPAEAIAKAREAAQKAIQLDARLAEGHASLGLAHSLDPREWSIAEPSFVRAIELDPGYPPAHQWYAALLAKTGRISQAVRESKIATDLDPLSVQVNLVYAWMLFFNRQFEEARQQALRTLDLDKTFRNPHLLLARIYEQQKNFEQAAAECAILTAYDQDTAVTLSIQGTTAALAGRLDDARRIARELERRRPREHFPSSYIASVYAVAGDNDRAFDWLERARQENDSSVLFVQVHPYYDSLRADPRYAGLLDRLGLPRAPLTTSKESGSSPPR